MTREEVEIEDADVKDVADEGATPAKVTETSNNE